MGRMGIPGVRRGVISLGMLCNVQSFRMAGTSPNKNVFLVLSYNSKNFQKNLKAMKRGHYQAALALAC